MFPFDPPAGLRGHDGRNLHRLARAMGYSKSNLCRNLLALMVEPASRDGDANRTILQEEP